MLTRHLCPQIPFSVWAGVFDDKISRQPRPVSKRALRSGCRKEDIVARMGGDEFVVLLPGATSTSCAHRLQMLHSAVRDASKALGVEVSVSLGAAFYPEDSSSAEALLGVADRRMYAHKPGGGEREIELRKSSASKLAGAL